MPKREPNKKTRNSKKKATRSKLKKEIRFKLRDCMNDAYGIGKVLENISGVLKNRPLRHLSKESVIQLPLPIWASLLKDLSQILSEVSTQAYALQHKISKIAEHPE